MFPDSATVTEQELPQGHRAPVPGTGLTTPGTVTFQHMETSGFQRIRCGLFSGSSTTPSAEPHSPSVDHPPDHPPHPLLNHTASSEKDPTDPLGKRTASSAGSSTVFPCRSALTVRQIRPVSTPQISISPSFRQSQACPAIEPEGREEIACGGPEKKIRLRFRTPDQIALVPGKILLIKSDPMPK